MTLTPTLLLALLLAFAFVPNLVVGADAGASDAEARWAERARAARVAAKAEQARVESASDELAAQLEAALDAMEATLDDVSGCVCFCFGSLGLLRCFI